MDQRLMLELMTEIAVGLNTARSNPVGQPVVDIAVANTLSVLKRIFLEQPEFTVSLSDGTFICEDLRVEKGVEPSMTALVDELSLKGITGITFKSTTTEQDIALLYSWLVEPHVESEGWRSSKSASLPEGTQSIVLESCQRGPFPQKAVRHKMPEEIIKAIRGLVEKVKRHGAISDARAPFIEVVNDIEGVSSNDWNSYREAVASVIELLPLEKRIALLQDIEMKPFALVLLSRLESETLVELMINWERQGKAEYIVKTLGAVDKMKLAAIVPGLKNRQSKIYQYLFHAGVNLLVEDFVVSTVTKDDLKTVLQPYLSMLKVENAERRADAYRSLLSFATRLMQETEYEMGDIVASRVTSAIDGENDEMIIGQFIDGLAELYRVSNEQDQKDVCENLIEVFGNILGRAELSLSLRKRIIEFLSATRNPSVLPTLFSLLWESGLYPDVRSAIIGFKGHAVSEAVQLLRYAEEFALRMKLIDILKKMGDESTEVLMDNLDAREWFLRRNIVRIFGEIGEPDICPRLEKLLLDDDYRVRLEVVRAYSKLNYKVGLLRSLKDSSLQVKSEALRGLRSMIDTEEFIDLLHQLGASGDEVYVEMLKIIDEKRIFEAMHWIADLLKRLEWRVDGSATEIKELGVAALAKLNSNEAKMILLDLRDSQDKVLANLASNTLKRLK